ncbi:hypothetical protein H072_7708 [Dactylellina haptotyla CBS 200.50]|uniref:Borealin N-terminal domain-containing protein n=1 Tax=Dactylellina haptotyla (strain CBS 200.50) TaxID=1284197 RepID=S8BTJ1_DACHA|nr:hypothetical protein H072_7708 [Dactylellina haptotyla CBS 200.50]
MPPIRRKKRGEDDSSDTSVAQSSKPSSRTVSAASKSSTTSNTRTNPLSNKTTRPVNSRNSPEHPTASKAPTKAAVSRQNPTKQSAPKQTLKHISIPPPEPLRDSTPVSPISPVAHEHNQLSIREITPPSAQPGTELVRHEPASPTRNCGEIVPRTPTTAMKKPQTRKISQFEKDRLIENIRYEVERRSKALRQRYTLQAEMLRQGIELRVGRIPYKMRNMTMGELYDQAVAAVESAKAEQAQLEARQVVKEIEDVRRLSNQAEENGNQLKVVKKRVSPAKPTEIPMPSMSPVKPSTIKLVRSASPVQTIPVVQASSPVKAQTFTQKAVTGIRSRLTSKKAAASTAASTATASATTTRTAKTAAASAASAAATKATKATRGARAKAAVPATTASTAAPKKPATRSLRSRK